MIEDRSRSMYIPRAMALLLCAFVTLWCSSARADEGMYPMTRLRGLDLAAKGLAVTARDIYNPDSIDLADAIVNLRGCTGSFVSAGGLILTNYHCAFGAVQGVSSTERDLLASGFVAQTQEAEIPLEGQTARIKESARDVSVEVLSVVTDTTDPAERTRRIGRKIRELVAEAERAHPGMSAEVSEMFPGRSYVLFLYTTLKDIRLVFAPPRSVGEFGGEEDNWVWPRHTGDFTFYRAYAAPDGSPAGFAKENIPYRPKRFLRVQAAGVDDGDAVFILGYPGRTMRHQPAAFLAFEQNVRMPFIVELYDRQIAVMEEAGTHSPAVALKHAPRIKSLANTLKNNRGKIQGIRRLGLLETRRKEERDLQAFIEADPARTARHGTVLREIDEVYTEITATSSRDLILDQLPRASIPLDAALTIHEAILERAKPDSARSPRFTDTGIIRTRQAILSRMKDLDPPADRILLRDLCVRASSLPAGMGIPEIGAQTDADDLDDFLDDLYEETRLLDTAVVSAALRDPATADGLKDDPFLHLAAKIFPLVTDLRRVRQSREGRLNRALPLYLEAREAFLGRDFLPDANSTMRFTHGRIRGYAPADAVYLEPLTTLTGVKEKTTGREPFITPSRLLEARATAPSSRFAHPRLKDIPVALLYNLDTVGGNSGSPLMNARGELVGVNFDRAFEATVNDFAWSESYSRSIAVDIRYVLWVTETLGAPHLVAELGVR